MQRWRLWGMLALVMVAGCARVGTTPAISDVTAGHLAQISLRLGDVPTQDRLVMDETPTNDQLAALWGQPQMADALAQTGRLAGSYRIFAFVAPEPSVYNGTMRATVEIDLFPDATRAGEWLHTLATTLASQDVPLAAPGQEHIVHVVTTTVGDTVATHATLLFRTANVVAAITTEGVGPNASIADAERYASLINDRITSLST